MLYWLYLISAAFLNSTYILLLKGSHGWERAWIVQTVIILACYPIVNYLLAWSFKGIAVGVGSFLFYASCCLLCTLGGLIFFNEKLDLNQMIGVSFVLLGFLWLILTYKGDVVGEGPKTAKITVVQTSRG
jgi:multidrug transporter EmrE-like cation transporter